MMEKYEYGKMFEMENEHWWYTGLRELVFANMRKYDKSNPLGRMLDAGCGTGKVLELSTKVFQAFGMDICEEALRYCRMRGLASLVRASVERSPFADKLFNVLVSLDVIYHSAVEDDLKVLQEFHRLLVPGGLLLLNLPAYHFLASRHDQAIHTRRRYTCSSLESLLRRAGFHIERLTYRNTVLFTPAALVRLAGKLCSPGGRAVSDLRMPPGFINKFLLKIIRLENRLIRAGANLPFGLSVFCVARRP